MYINNSHDIILVSFEKSQMLQKYYCLLSLKWNDMAAIFITKRFKNKLYQILWIIYTSNYIDIKTNYNKILRIF